MEKKRDRSKEPWLAVVLSSLLMGIGQVYSGRILRGGILILMEVALACLAIRSLLDAECDVLVTGCIYLAILAVRIWNLFDAYECARSANPEDFETERKQIKDAWLALFLADLIPGLGQIYVKKWLWGALFMVASVPLLAIGIKYRLLRDGLWAVFSALVCYHAYMSAPIRRERFGKTISIVAGLILCSYLLVGCYAHVFKTHVVEAFRIPTTAMKPTRLPGDRLLVRQSKKYIPQRGDVVAFKSPDGPDVIWVKRIAALSDEIVEITDGVLFINGQQAKYRTIESIGYFEDTFGVEKPYKVPANHIFVIGDNTGNSNDSRFFGPVPRSNVIGRAYKIYWPLSRRGPIK
jgi:signal peptidase I